MAKSSGPLSDTITVPSPALFPSSGTVSVAVWLASSRLASGGVPSSTASEPSAATLR